MSYASERQDIETLFKNEWVLSGGAPLTPVAYDDQDFDAVPLEQSGTAWVRLTIHSGDAEVTSVGSPGSNTKRHAGAVSIQINVAAGRGSREARLLADKVEEIFNCRIDGGIRYSATYSGGSPERSGVWSTMTIWCPFTRDEFNS